MNRCFYKITALLLTVLLLSTAFCLPAGAAADRAPSAEYLALSELVTHTEESAYLWDNSWTEETHAVFQDKYLYAKGVLENPASTDEDYRDAKKELQAAIYGLKALPSYMRLLTLMGVAEGLMWPVMGDYSDESWQALLDAYEYADKICNDPLSVDQDYLNAGDRLEYAINHLEEFSDKTALWDLLYAIMDSGMSKNYIKYTNTSYQVFYEAYRVAYDYGVQYRIPQETLDTLQLALQQAVDSLVLLGDVNGDHSVSIADVLEIQKSLAGVLTLNETQAEAADVDASGAAGVADIVCIQKYIAGMLGHFPAGEQNEQFPYS